MIKFKYWYIRNQQKITWFVIGWMVTQGLRDLAMGNFVGAIISFLIAWLNYVMSE